MKTDSTDNKRKRINFYKRCIIVSLSAVILIPIVVCAVLLWKVHILEKKIAGIEQTVAEYRMDIEEKMDALTESSKNVENREETVPEADAQGQEEKEEQKESEGKKVYLTFDDGPSACTDEILDILARYNVKATFFVVGKTDEVSKAAYRRIVEEGHTLGMHSYSHRYEDVYSSREAFEEDMLKLQSYLYQETGVASKYYRFPGGSSNTISNVDMQEFISCLHERGVEYYDWNVSNGDSAGVTPEVDVLLENVMKDVGRFEISMVLMHDDVNKHRTVEALEELIQKLTEQGCVLLPIDENVPPVQHIRPEE